METMPEYPIDKQDTEGKGYIYKQDTEGKARFNILEPADRLKPVIFHIIVP